MSVEKIDKLESQMYEQQKLLGKIEGILENISKTLEDAISIKNDVVTQKEKHKVTEARLIDIEKECKELRRDVQGVNLKIAMASGVWVAIMAFISKL